MSNAPTRRYVIFGKDGMIGERMVLATNQAAAIAHVARSMLDSRVATPDDIERLVAMGVRTEKPGDAPPAAQGQQADLLGDQQGGQA